MPERVVDALEAVQIDEKHREAWTTLACAFDAAGEQIEKARAVRQAGQMITECERADLLLASQTFALVTKCDNCLRAHSKPDFAADDPHGHQPASAIDELGIGFLALRQRCDTESRDEIL